jgi:hypothetical protein
VRELAAGLLVIVLDLPATCYLSGHPSEMIVVVLWSHAVLDMAEQRSWRAGLWIAFSAALVTQGAVGLVILLGSPRRRRRLIVTSAAALVVIAVYAPFAFLGVVRTQDYVWTVAGSSLWGPLLGSGHEFPWSARLVQGAAMGIVGLLAIRRLHGRAITWWLVPAVIMLMRLLLDPTNFEYYWTGVESMYVVGLCTANPSSWRRDVPFYIAGYPILLHGAAPAVFPAAIALAAFAYALAWSPGGTSPREAGLGA